ncbi:unnamed protein product [Diabrotica balteata]|uniref:Regulatory protein zeste n=1 Tax=Diabrotica balteata TaxID=107213 RepID=A0A9N9TFW6_DIABA|nr:unnamed protein product [Diabrotica balteata]
MEIDDDRNIPPDRGRKESQYQNINLNNKYQNGSNKVSEISIENIEKNYYLLGDQGPYYVFVENKSGNIGKLHRIGAARLILNAENEIKHNIVNISIIGRNKLKVECNTFLAANKLAESKTLSDKNYDAYIPTFYTQKRGVVRHVDTDISEIELKGLIKGKFGQVVTVTQVKRMFRKSEDKLIPTGTVIVSFKGQTIPSQVVIEKIVYDVETYIPKIIQCLKCLRYGHIAKQCRGKERCKFCGNEHISDTCEKQNNPSCIFCTGNHSATDKFKCPEFSEQKSIKRLMATENISYVEALNRHKSSYASATKSPTEGSKYTVNIKRKRIATSPLPPDPITQEHRDIITLPTVPSRPVYESFRNIPQYHKVPFSQPSSSSFTHFDAAYVEDPSLLVGSAIGPVLWLLCGSSMALGFRTALGSSMALGFGTALGSSMALGFGSALGSSMALGFGTALGSSMALSFGTALDSSMALGFGTALGSSMALGFCIALGSSMALGFVSNRRTIEMFQNMNIKLNINKNENSKPTVSSTDQQVTKRKHPTLSPIISTNNIDSFEDFCSDDSIKDPDYEYSNGDANNRRSRKNKFKRKKSLIPSEEITTDYLINAPIPDSERQSPKQLDSEDNNQDFNNEELHLKQNVSSQPNSLEAIPRQSKSRSSSSSTSSSSSSSGSNSCSSSSSSSSSSDSEADQACSKAVAPSKIENILRCFSSSSTNEDETPRDCVAEPVAGMFTNNNFSNPSDPVASRSTIFADIAAPCIEGKENVNSRKERKQKARPNNWLRAKAKILRNSGSVFTSRTMEIDENNSGKKRPYIEVDPDTGIEVPSAKRLRVTPDNIKKVKCLKFLLNSYEKIIEKTFSEDIRNEAYASISLAHKVTNVIFASFTVLRQEASGTNRTMVAKTRDKKTFPLNYLGGERSILLEEANYILKEEAANQGFEFRKFGPNEDAWYGTVMPYLDFFVGNQLRLRELRLGHSVAPKGKAADGTLKQFSVIKYGLNGSHHILLEGCTYPPEKKSAMAQSVGPMTALLQHITVDRQYRGKWTAAYMRVNADHWAILLDFAEKNPSIITKRFPGCNDKEKVTELWKQLSNKLNALGYGEKTTAEWKKTLTHWKSKVKGKAAGIKTYESKTGGGQSCSQQLYSYELRLLCIMGKSSYEGNPKNEKVGLKKRKLHDIPLEETAAILQPNNDA